MLCLLEELFVVVVIVLSPSFRNFLSKFSPKYGTYFHSVHAWAVRPLSPTLTIFLPLALQCLGGLESIHQQLVLCVQSLQSQRSVVLETWDLSVSPQVPPYLGPHVMAVVLPGHWFCSADRTRISWSLENWTSTQTSAVKGIVPFWTTSGWIQFLLKGCICFVFPPC